MIELAKAYEPAPVEERLYEKWQKAGYYRANPASAKPPFSIVMPPPNVTGRLHMGHVLNNTIQDLLCRKARLEGHEVLWLPGTDHAGLATQTAVEKHIRNSEKKTRRDFTREEFVQRIWKWKEEFGGAITQQLRRIGCSCDWSRERFTLDQDYAQGVQDVFVKLYNRGLIYRDKRMVNWCPGSLTAISDEEVVPEEQMSQLYYVRYELIDPRPDDGTTFLEVATTRPETIMADVALAVKPGGKWAKFIGRQVTRPLRHARIPVIADEAVEEGFGTGVLKVTPAHDKVDFEIGQRHNLPIEDILTPEGKIEIPGVHDAAELHGLDRFVARKRSAEILQERGLLSKAEPYKNTVKLSERARVPIEPRLSLQWFMRYPKIAEALELVRTGLVKFHPDNWVKVYEHWLENIQPWCISRQVWWGHRIPVWYPAEGSDAKPKCQIESPGADWRQDEDTLDTWFSSWLWAYETMAEHDGTRARFYPTDVLVTGPDIIFLWVARMLIAGLEFQPNSATTLAGQLAYKHVYYTGIIRDKEGRKMAKQYGNSPEPLDLIAKYGIDGLRFGMMRMAPLGQDIRFDEKQVEEGRNFCNKLWNICRFRTMYGAIDPDADPFAKGMKRTIFANELLSGLNRLLSGERNFNRALDQFHFSEAANLLYDFVWNEFAARFVEAGKVDLNDNHSPTRAGTLATFDYVMSQVLRLLHPFSPFVTEELWCEMGFGSGANAQTIQFAEWPKFSPLPGEVDARASDLYGTADAGRALRGETKLPSNQKLPFLLEVNPVALAKDPLDAAQKAVLMTLLNASELKLLEKPPEPAGPMIFSPLGKLYLPATGLVDPTQEKERLGKELAKVQKDLESTRKKLGDEGVLAKAPAAKVKEWRDLEVTLAEKQKSLTEMIGKLPVQT